MFSLASDVFSTCRPLIFTACTAGAVPDLPPPSPVGAMSNPAPLTIGSPLKNALFACTQCQHQCSATLSYSCTPPPICLLDGIYGSGLALLPPSLPIALIASFGSPNAGQHCIVSLHHPSHFDSLSLSPPPHLLHWLRTECSSSTHTHTQIQS